MESGSRKQSTAPAGQYRAPAAVLFFAVSLILWLLMMKGAEPGAIKGHILDTGRVTLAGILTSSLFHLNGYHLSIAALLVLFLGSILERRWGTTRFVVFYLLATWGSAAVTVLAAFTLEQPGYSCGGGGVVMATLVVLGLLYPEYRLVRALPPVRHMAWFSIFVAAAALVAVDAHASDPPTFLLPQVSGVAFGLVFVAGESWFCRLSTRWKARRQKERQERVVAIRHRVDELLEKISVSGYESLTPGEKSFLRQASKHYRSS